MFVCLCIWMSCMCRCLQREDESMGSLGTGVTSSSEQPCGCWEPNSSPLKEKVLLTAETSLHHRPPHSTIFIVLLREWLNHVQRCPPWLSSKPGNWHLVDVNRIPSAKNYLSWACWVFLGPLLTCGSRCSLPPVIFGAALIAHGIQRGLVSWRRLEDKGFPGAVCCGKCAHTPISNVSPVLCKEAQ